MYEPVAYDVSIRLNRNLYEVDIREDDAHLILTRESLSEAQEVLEGCTPDIYSGPDTPWSVFCPIHRCMNESL